MSRAIPTLVAALLLFNATALGQSADVLNLVSEEVGTLPENMIDPVIIELLASQDPAKLSETTAAKALDPAGLRWDRSEHNLLYRGHPATAELRAKRRRLLRAARDTALLEQGLVVHEWGTTTGTFDTVGEDQSDLPPFVQVWSKQPVQVIHAIEKPILYFYTQEATTVDVQVTFPQGMLTQWYPKPSSFAPQRINYAWGGGQQQELKNGQLKWNNLKLDPAAKPDRFAKVDAGHPWWHITRDTDATPIIAAGGTVERFLFYRGAGDYTPSMKPKRTGDRVAAAAPQGVTLEGVFLVRVAEGQALVEHTPRLAPGKSIDIGPVPEDASSAAAAATTAKAQMQEALEVAGLFPTEAAGLVKIWGDDFFTTPGDRLFYIMPQAQVDAMLPLQITPAPASQARVLIAWVELSTTTTEEQVLALVEQLGSDDFAEREAAEAALVEIDRFAEAILRRIVRETKDEEIPSGPSACWSGWNTSGRAGPTPRTTCLKISRFRRTSTHCCWVAEPLAATMARRVPTTRPACPTTSPTSPSATTLSGSPRGSPTSTPGSSGSWPRTVRRRTSAR